MSQRADSPTRKDRARVQLQYVGAGCGGLAWQATPVTRALERRDWERCERTDRCISLAGQVMSLYVRGSNRLPGSDDDSVRADGAHPVPQRSGLPCRRCTAFLPRSLDVDELRAGAARLVDENTPFRNLLQGRPGEVS